MATRVPLPRRDALPEWVLLHREDPRQETVILQVPNADRTDAATYIIRLDREGDVGWLEGFPNYRELRGKLDLEPHLVVNTQNGHIDVIADLDAPGPFAEAIKRARAEGSHAAPGIMERMFARRRHRTAPTAGPTPLRSALMGRGRNTLGGTR
jgi:hypothetical protein